MPEGIRLFNGKNASALNAQNYVSISLEKELLQDKKVSLLPANACYIQNLDANATLYAYINDLSGAVYFIEPQKDKFFTGENIWQIILYNSDASNNISANEIMYSFYKTKVFTGAD